MKATEAEVGKIYKSHSGSYLIVESLEPGGAVSNWFSYENLKYLEDGLFRYDIQEIEQCPRILKSFADKNWITEKEWEEMNNLTELKDFKVGDVVRYNFTSLNVTEHMVVDKLEANTYQDKIWFITPAGKRDWGQPCAFQHAEEADTHKYKIGEKVFGTQSGREYTVKKLKMTTVTNYLLVDSKSGKEFVISQSCLKSSRSKESYGDFAKEVAKPETSMQEQIKVLEIDNEELEAIRDYHKNDCEKQANTIITLRENNNKQGDVIYSHGVTIAEQKAVISELRAKNNELLVTLDTKNKIIRIKDGTNEQLSNQIDTDYREVLLLKSLNEDRDIRIQDLEGQIAIGTERNENQAINIQVLSGRNTQLTESVKKHKESAEKYEKLLEAEEKLTSDYEDAITKLTLPTLTKPSLMKRVFG